MPAASKLAAVALLPLASGQQVQVPYVAPDTTGLHWAETFDGDALARWTHSVGDKYDSKFVVEKRAEEAITDDVGMSVPEEAKHYGISAKFEPLEGSPGGSFVVQFEAKFQNDLTCGGSYLKLFDSARTDGFKDDTPYVVMFGPDKCGGTNKVHFILQHKSPKTGKWEEKHCTDVPSVPSDRLTHLYKLVVNADNTFEISIDGERKTNGDLMTSMQPAINPAKEIDDPSDSKPEDWVDVAKIDDPESAKPDDWDEEAPHMIVDDSVSKPEGWADDATKEIGDPAAKKPEDWDDEEDGDWEPPMVANPACKVGCGPWDAPQISNPAYKGKWHAPQVDNPAYLGMWKSRQVANPDYFYDDAPGVLPRIDSVGIDIWTMNKGVLFDNLVISSDVNQAKVFADATFGVRKKIEEAMNPKELSESMFAAALEFITANAAAVAVTVATLLATTLWCCCRSPAGSAAELERKREARRQKKEAAAVPADQDDSAADAAANGVDAKAPAGGEDEGDAVAAAADDDDASTEQKEGGLGMDGDEE